MSFNKWFEEIRISDEKVIGGSVQRLNDGQLVLQQRQRHGSVIDTGLHEHDS
jgi:hypothetical protein